MINSLHITAESEGEKNWKSVNICRSYGQLSRGRFFMKHGVSMRNLLLLPNGRRTVGRNIKIDSLTIRATDIHINESVPMPSNQTIRIERTEGRSSKFNECVGWHGRFAVRCCAAKAATRAPVIRRLSLITNYKLTRCVTCSGAATICPRLLQVATEQPPRAFGLELTAHVGDAVHHTPSVYQVWSSSAFPFRRYGLFSVTASIGLVTLTFDLLTSKWCHSWTSWTSWLTVYS